MNPVSESPQTPATDDPRATPGRLLRAYLRAFEAKDADRIRDLAGDSALVEVPLLKPNRLFGAAEVYRGHRAIFASLEAISFELDDAIADDGKAAIALGSLSVARNHGGRDRHDFGLVVETRGQSVHRISLYLNSRNLRRWADETIV